MFVEINDKYNALVREKKRTFMLELECNCKCVTKKGSKKIVTENLYQPQFFLVSYMLRVYIRTIS